VRGHIQGRARCLGEAALRDFDLDLAQEVVPRDLDPDPDLAQVAVVPDPVDNHVRSREDQEGILLEGGVRLSRAPLVAVRQAEGALAVAGRLRDGPVAWDRCRGGRQAHRAQRRRLVLGGRGWSWGMARAGSSLLP
jgi:hypothetical protein